MRTLFPSTLVLTLALTLAAPATSGAEELPLPPADCVRMLRSARIAQMEGKTAWELEILRRAAETYPREIAPIHALLDYHRRHPLAADEHGRLLGLLMARLEDREEGLPAGVLRWMIADPATEESTLRLVARHLERRLETRPADEATLLGALAEVRERLGEEAAAAESLERLLRVEPSESTRWRLYRLYHELERWEEAAGLLDDLVDGELAEALRGIYLQLLGRAGKIEEQNRQIELYLAESGTGHAALQRIFVLLDSAWDLRDAGQDAEAKRLFERVLEIEPENPEARAALVHLYGTEAERLAFAAVAREQWREEEDAQALFEEGTRRLTTGDAEGAIGLLRRAAPGLPGLEAAWYNLGMAAYRLEDWETTASAFARAGELNPERAESHFFRGVALHNLGRWSEAIEPLSRALALDPGRTLAHYYLAACYRRTGDRASADRHSKLYAASRANE